MHKTPAELLSILDASGFQTSTVSHPPLFTVDDSKSLRGELPGGHCKNLFLRNKKGMMWLVVAHEDLVIDLKELGELIGAGRISFGSVERLERYLGVIPGAVTPFAVVNDVDAQVHVVIDKTLMNYDVVNFHPLTNDQTTAITPSDLVRFLVNHGHEPTVIDLS